MVTNEKLSKIGLYGPSCSGKSFLMNTLLGRGYRLPVAITSRPRRDTDGPQLENIDYDTAFQLYNNKALFLPTIYNGHVYGYPWNNIVTPCVVELTLNERGELQEVGGTEIAILPLNFNSLYDKIISERSQGVEGRIAEARAYESLASSLTPAFINDFAGQSTSCRWEAFLDTLA